MSADRDQRMEALTGNPEAIIIADLVQLIFRLTKELPPDHKYRVQALDYIKRKKLTSPLR